MSRAAEVIRERLIPRQDWQQRCESQGFMFHSVGGVYWDESACYRFDSAQVDQLEAAANDLHHCCLELVERVVAGGHYERFAIPESAIGLIEASWRAGEAALYGRFDFSWNGRGEPKLLEYNADTPTSLLEASVVQWFWLQDVQPDADQFNGIHEHLLARWQALAAERGAGPVYFTSVPTSAEDFGNIEYMRDVALQAGVDARHIFVDDIGWDRRQRCFVDAEGQRLDWLVKLYPWEWLMQERFGEHLAPARPRIIEPAWKMLLSNKALLPLLWQMFPGHPNLLPASFRAEDIRGDFVRKPILSREGANVTALFQGHCWQTSGAYGAEGFVYQAAAPLPCHDGNYPVLGVWMVGDAAAGMGIREDDTPITRNTSRFVPHYFVH